MQQRRWFRIAAIGSATALVVLAAAACAPSPAPSTTAPPSSLVASDFIATSRDFEDADIAFRYPAEWQEAVFDVVSSFSRTLVYLSTSSISDPCVRAPDSVSCGAPVDGLTRNGMLVEWSRRSFPGWTFDPRVGRLTTVAGRRATISEEAAESGCQLLHGEREVVVTIDDPVPDQNWTEMRACLRGPDFEAQMRSIGAMLDSVTWRP